MPETTITQSNVALVNRFFEDVMNGGNPGAARELLTEDSLVHHCLLPGGQGGVQDVGVLMNTLHTGFPDLHYRLADHVADGDRVAVRWLATGTHEGPIFNIPPTGIPVSVGGNDIVRIADGRIAEVWVCSDLISLLQQIGAFPPPPAAGGR